MYIENLEVSAFGPIEDLDLNLLAKNGEVLKPTIFLGKNGSGKTLLMGSILDAIIELKRRKYTTIPEIQKEKLFKIGKKNYIKYEHEVSTIKIGLASEKGSATYVDVMSNINYNLFQEKYPYAHSLINNNQSFSEHGFYKNVEPTGEILKCFDENIFMYFPHSRYYRPAWLSKTINENALGFSLTDTFIEESSVNIIKSNVLSDIESWILDLVLDRELYEKVLINQPIPALNNITLPVFIGYNGKNDKIIVLINELLTSIYKTKFPLIRQARLGIANKGDRKVSIYITEADKPEFIISPTFSHLSSGEVMTLSLFASILKEYDRISSNSLDSFDNVSGIVIIDEIDLHLHVELQRLVLPELIAKFPKVQFILTTHSPFFLLGMKDKFDNNVNLFSLPSGGQSDFDDLSIVNEAYDVFLSGFQILKNSYNTVQDEISKIRQPIIITEGKTDWKHLKAALKKLNNENKFHELDFAFLEFDDKISMSDTELMNLCKNLSKIPQDRKIICIFDNDVPNIVKEMNQNGSYKDWGNNVYSFCIPVPTNRENYKNISIEFYYSDEEIHTIDAETNKQLLFSNEVEQQINKNLTTNKTKSEIVKLDNPNIEDEFNKKIYCEDVSSIRNQEGNYVAHSKSVFADNILNEKEGFQNFDVREFENIFLIVEQILLV